MIRHSVLAFIFCFLFVLISKGQRDNGIDDCGLLEKFMNDRAVKKYLFSHPFEGFFLSNRSKYFKSCSSITIDGKKHQTNDSLGVFHNDKYCYPVSIYVSKDDENTLRIALDWVPYEEGLIITAKMKHNKYVITDVNRVSTD